VHAFRSRLRAAVAAFGAVVLAAGVAHATLETEGFRAVGVALSRYPISSIAVAPDGRMFAAVQALGQGVGGEPSSAEIRVFSAYATNDGSTLDEGAAWATLDDVRASTVEEGLLGIALAPDFATSRLVYVHLTTTADDANEQIRVFRDDGAGKGVYLGTVATGIEPPDETSSRKGGPLVFGADGCLYAGVGDNGSGSRWNAQILRGTEPISGSESNTDCNDVCLGTTEYPARTGDTAGDPNDAGKVLRFAVEGASPAQGGPGAPFATQPFVYAAGLRDPVGLLAHPLTGQLWATERGDSQRAEIDVLDSGSNGGWPCLEGEVTSTSGVASCLAGHTADEVLAMHPEWRRPVATHTGNPVPSGLAAYTGLAYPAEYYGDVFYLLRDSARIYRIDLEPPCFLPHPGGVTPIEFHDTNQDGDFVVTYDIDNDDEFENVSLTNLVAIAQGPDPLGRQVLYVVGRQGNGNGLTDDTVIFRIEYATQFVPYGGPLGRVADACFSNGVYSGGGSGPAPYAWENPFARPTCLPPGGPCPGQPNGTPCPNGDPCDGDETCKAGICQHAAPAPDGTACTSSAACRDTGSCSAGRCVDGPVLPDGSSCADADPCNGTETCSAGVCMPGAGPEPLRLRKMVVGRAKRRGSGSLVLTGAFRAPAPIAPESSDDLSLALSDGGGTVWSGTLQHPASTPRWKRRGGTLRYTDRRGSADGLTSVVLKRRKSGDVQLAVRGRKMRVEGLDEPSLATRLVIGGQCFETRPHCKGNPKRMRCGR
jgi:glucose/arabinose dehydrogenase